MELREYQTTALDEIVSALHSGKGAVAYTLATGGGKTAIAASIIKRFGRGLFVAPTLSVIEQAPAEMAKWGVYAGAIGSGLTLGTGTKAWNAVDKDVTICCSYITAYNQADPGEFDILVVDEAHHASDGKGRITALINAFKTAGKPVVGFTATMWRMGKFESYDHTWDSLIQGPQWNDLLNADYLAQVKLFSADSDEYITGSGRGYGGDYTEKGTEKANERNPTFTEGAIGVAEQEIAEGKRVILYAVSISHAEKLALLAHENGINPGLLVSRRLDSQPDETISDPTAVRNGLRDGTVKLVINVNMITEGYDCPDVECIIITRPTKSLALYLQMCGRGSRLSDDKDTVTIYDLTDNTERLGHPLENYVWNLEARGERSGDGPAPVKKCPSCDGLSPGGSRHCSCCEEALGWECPHCQIWRYWKHYEESKSKWCGICVDQSKIAPGLIPVQRIENREDRNGRHYYRLYLDRYPAWVNVFKWHKTQYEAIKMAVANSCPVSVRIKKNQQGYYEVKSGLIHRH